MLIDFVNCTQKCRLSLFVRTASALAFSLSSEFSQFMGKNEFFFYHHDGCGDGFGGHKVEAPSEFKFRKIGRPEFVLNRVMSAPQIQPSATSSSIGFTK